MEKSDSQLERLFRRSFLVDLTFFRLSKNLAIEAKRIESMRLKFLKPVLLSLFLKLLNIFQRRLTMSSHFKYFKISNLLRSCTNIKNYKISSQGAIQSLIWLLQILLLTTSMFPFTWWRTWSLVMYGLSRKCFTLLFTRVNLSTQVDFTSEKGSNLRRESTSILK